MVYVNSFHVFMSVFPMQSRQIDCFVSFLQGNQTILNCCFSTYNTLELLIIPQEILWKYWWMDEGGETEFWDTLTMLCLQDAGLLSESSKLFVCFWPYPTQCGWLPALYLVVLFFFSGRGIRAALRLSLSKLPPSLCLEASIKGWMRWVHWLCHDALV